jgi:hypothetical protein
MPMPVDIDNQHIVFYAFLKVYAFDTLIVSFCYTVYRPEIAIQVYK